MADLSRLIHPRAVEFFQRFMNRQAVAAMAVTGAPATTWTGNYTARGHQVQLDLGVSLATVTWAGDIEYDANLVTQPIWTLCRRAGQDIERWRLGLARKAFRIAFHENLHAVNQPGRVHQDSMEAFQDPANRALEEGLTELFARRYLNEYLRELGVAEVAPGVMTAGDYVDDTYPHFVPAVEVLVQRLGERTGLGEDEIMRRLITIDCETRWQVVGDLLFDAEGLADLVPAADHAMVKRRLLSGLRQPFTHLAELNGSVDEIIVASTAAGYASLGWFDQDVEALRLEHDPERRPEQLADSLLQRHEEAALAVTGAHHVTPSGHSVADLRLTDGSTVGEIVQQMCEHAGERNQPPDVLARYKEAFHLILEHDTERSAGRLREYGMEPDKLSEPGVAVLSRGLARALADDRLNKYVDQLGLDEIAPGIRAVPSPRPPDPAAAAARVFVHEIGSEIQVRKVKDGKSEPAALTEKERDELLRRLAGQDPALPWKTVTDLVYDSQPFSRYPDSDEINEVKAVIRQSMTEVFARIDVPVPAALDPIVAAEALGRQTAGTARQTLAELEQILRSPAPQTPIPPPPPEPMHSTRAQVPTDARLAIDLLTTARPTPSAEASSLAEPGNPSGVAISRAGTRAAGQQPRPPGSQGARPSSGREA